VYAFGTKLRQQVFSSQDFGLNTLNRPSPITNFTTSFSGRWTAFDSRQTHFQIRRASQLKQSAEFSAGRTSQETIYRTVSAYESVLIASREVEVARHAMETAQALYDLSRNRVNAGLVVESDALSAQVNLSQRKQDLIQAEGTRQAQWAELEAAVGISLPLGPESLEELKEQVFTAGALAEEIAQALQNRPDLASLAIETGARKTAVQSAKWDFGPRVNVFGSWQTDRHSFAGNGGENWMSGAELRVDLLPMAKRWQLEQEKVALLSAQAGEESARNMVRVEVSRAYFGQQAAAQMLEVARGAMAQAAESLRILRNRYDAGLVSVTDVLRAEDADRQSQSGYWQAVYRNALSYAALRLATGTLNVEQVVNLQ
jgi:outer membrane protein TolC